ncbi:MAG: HD domain-containing protein [DPANN group archaeon]|nr:HD domain-containing protein [DPANN group archaeon]
MIDNAIENTQIFVSKKMGQDPLFGYLHAERVRMNALKLAETLGGNKQIVQIAALFDDISFNKNNVETHAIESANIAKTFLEHELKFPTVKINAILNIIKKHERRVWSEDFKPETLEEKIVFDAEVMERVSALGFVKFIHTAGTLNFNSRELINLLNDFIENNYSAIFFDETKKHLEWDYRLVGTMLKNIKTECEF